MGKDYVRKDHEVVAKRAMLEPFKDRLSKVYDIGVNVTGPMVNAVGDDIELDKCDPQRALLNAIMVVKLLTDICIELPPNYKEEVEWEWVNTIDTASEPPKTLTLLGIQATNRNRSRAGQYLE